MWSQFLAWLAMPFKTDMSAQRWFAFVGLLIAILIVWSYVLRELKAQA